MENSRKRIIQKTAEATGDLIGNKTADKITKTSIGSPQNNQIQLKMKQEMQDSIEKYQNKDVYLLKIENKLLMIQDKYNNIKINLLDNTPNQQNKFRMKNWIK